AGPIGCMAAGVARHAGARHIVVTDLSGGRLELARRMGATRAVDPRETDLAELQGELGMTEGFDVMFEMSGNADALRAGIGQMAHGGRVAILGIPTAPVELDLDPLIFNMLTVKGIYGREMYETWYQMSVMIDSGLDVSPVITHRFGFADFEEGFAVASSGDAGKVLLDWREV
ncbi:MAG TPA: zinc-binding dehydrogenase, partial [Gaiella sp.]|nr:zinc-binding dehydrogenase [Gaiella sp.]